MPIDGRFGEPWEKSYKAKLQPHHFTHSLSSIGHQQPTRPTHTLYLFTNALHNGYAAADSCHGRCASHPSGEGTTLTLELLGDHWNLAREQSRSILSCISIHLEGSHHQALAALLRRYYSELLWPTTPSQQFWCVPALHPCPLQTTATVVCRGSWRDGGATATTEKRQVLWEVCGRKHLCLDLACAAAASPCA